MIYCFDTNAFIQPWHNRYPIDLFPDFWEELEMMASEGDLLASDEVLKEISRIDDDLHKWVKVRPFIFRIPSTSVQQHVRSILADHIHQQLVHVGKNRSMADPFVIAQALESEAKVVTEERYDPKRKKVRIPDVCDALNVQHISVLEFMRENKMNFKLA